MINEPLQTETDLMSCATSIDSDQPAVHRSNQSTLVANIIWATSS